MNVFLVITNKPILKQYTEITCCMRPQDQKQRKEFNVRKFH